MHKSQLAPIWRVILYPVFKLHPIAVKNIYYSPVIMYVDSSNPNKTLCILETRVIGIKVDSMHTIPPPPTCGKGLLITQNFISLT